MGLIHKEKRADTISGSAQVYAGNTTAIIESFGFSATQTAEFCATLRESNGNGGKEWCKNRRAAEALS